MSRIDGVESLGLTGLAPRRGQVYCCPERLLLWGSSGWESENRSQSLDWKRQVLAATPSNSSIMQISSV
jgi:hypothetical protein